MGTEFGYVSFSALLLSWKKEQTGAYLLPELFFACTSYLDLLKASNTVEPNTFPCCSVHFTVITLGCLEAIC